LSHIPLRAPLPPPPSPLCPYTTLFRSPRPLGLQDQEGATEEDPDRQCGGHQESQQTQDRSGQGFSSTLSELPILSPVPAPPIPIEPVLRGAEARRPPAHLPGRHSPRPRAAAPCPP